MDASSASSRLVQEILSEQFGFAPSSFTRTAEDLANAAIYNVMHAVESEINQKFGQDSLAVKKALNALETLLENNVDKQFDRFEAFCFRNVFHLKEDLLPYMRLEHHPEEGYDERELRGQDSVLLGEWVRERDAADEAMIKAAAIRAAQARVDRRLAALHRLGEELDGLTEGRDADALREAFGSVATVVPAIGKEAAALLARPRLVDKPPELAGTEPWQTREGYIQWAASRGVQREGLQGMTKVKADVAETGTQEEAESLINLMRTRA